MFAILYLTGLHFRFAGTVPVPISGTEDGRLAGPFLAASAVVCTCAARLPRRPAVSNRLFLGPQGQKIALSTRSHANQLLTSAAKPLVYCYLEIILDLP